jgi:hypothetical protein
MDALEGIVVVQAYDRLIGVELEEVVLDAILESRPLLAEATSIRLDRGYDSGATREKLLLARDLIPQISKKGRPAPVKPPPDDDGSSNAPTPPGKTPTRRRRRRRRRRSSCVVHLTTRASGRLLSGGSFLE